MKTIKMGNNLRCIVDDSDFEWLSKYSWNRIGRGYAGRRGLRGIDSAKTIAMHREIMGLKPYDGLQVDHIDGNKLNNTRSNLRVCSNSQNHMNSAKPRGKNYGLSSAYKGVSRFRNRWVVGIGVEGKRVNLGAFISEIDAAKAYNVAAQNYFGEFAKLNRIP